MVRYRPWRDPVRLVSAGVFVASLAGFTIVAARQGNLEFVFYGATMVVMAAAVVLVDAIAGLSRASILGLLAWALLHLAGGNVPIEGAGVLYNYRPTPWLPKYDQATHAFGFGVATLVCWECLRSALVRRLGRPARPTAGLMVACVLMGTGLGALNEVVEFVAVLTMPSTNVGGYVNTGWDLVSNLVGAAAVGAGLWVLGRSRRRREDAGEGRPESPR
ncbi:MAG: hypothetical protein KatS3mg103_0078 [Phycisphaerales bacterium]|nr:MAG: hypothetical protein KatS3mg103_0078 [Phycisphaerales bacterium]